VRSGQSAWKGAPRSVAMKYRRAAVGCSWTRARSQTATRHHYFDVHGLELLDHSLRSGHSLGSKRQSPSWGQWKKSQTMTDRGSRAGRTPSPPPTTPVACGSEAWTARSRRPSGSIGACRSRLRSGWLSGRCPGGDPVVDLAGAVGDPASGVAQAQPCRWRGCSTTAVTRLDTTKGMLTSALRCTRSSTTPFLVQTAVGVLAESEEPFAS